MPKKAKPDFEDIASQLCDIDVSKCMILLSIIARRLDELDHVEAASVCAALLVTMLNHRDADLHKHVSKFVKVATVNGYWVTKFANSDKTYGVVTAE